MYITVHNEATYCYTGGKAPDPSRPTIVLLHGWGMHGVRWPRSVPVPPPINPTDAEEAEKAPGNPAIRAAADVEALHQQALAIRRFARNLLVQGIQATIDSAGIDWRDGQLWSAYRVGAAQSPRGHCQHGR